MLRIQFYKEVNTLNESKLVKDGKPLRFMSVNKVDFKDIEKTCKEENKRVLITFI